MIPGATEATLTLTNVQRTNAGSYEVRVSNAQGIVDTGATLIVYAPQTGPGSIDLSFPTLLGVPDPEFGASVRDMVKQRDGKAILCGTFSTVNGVARANLARLLPSGELDLTFNPPAYTADTLALQPDGKLLVGGRSGEELNEHVLARFNPDGTLDATFEPPFVELIFTHIFLAGHRACKKVQKYLALQRHLAFAPPRRSVRMHGIIE